MVDQFVASDVEQEVTVERLLSRQAEMVPEELSDLPIAIVGLGGIGSNVFATLARTGARRFTVYDFDQVEPENVFPSAFTMADVGQPKTQAIVNRMQEELGYDLDVTVRGRFDEGDEHAEHAVWIVGTDNMESRRAVWSAINRSRLYELFIDARMGGAGYEIYAVRSLDYDKARRYEEENLMPINDQDLPCGQKATAWLTRIIAGHVAEYVRNNLLGLLPTMPGMVLFDSDQQIRATGLED